MEIKLLTRDGGYVTTVSVPPFNPPPEVIMWGSRVFVRQPGGHYAEGMAWHSMEAPR